VDRDGILEADFNEEKKARVVCKLPMTVPSASGFLHRLKMELDLDLQSLFRLL
jgi:hypothetical protein